MPKLRLLGATKMPLARRNRRRARRPRSRPPSAAPVRRSSAGSWSCRSRDGPSSVNSLPSGTSNETFCAALTAAPRASGILGEQRPDAQHGLSTPSPRLRGAGKLPAIPNRLPTSCASSTSGTARRSACTPSAESSTYWPFCHSSQIMIDTTSVPGRVEQDRARQLADRDDHHVDPARQQARLQQRQHDAAEGQRSRRRRSWRRIPRAPCGSAASRPSCSACRRAGSA